MMFFVPNGLPKGYEITSKVVLGDTVYRLKYEGRTVAEEMTFLSAHWICVWKLRRAAWTRARNGIVG